jgi:hypothetical protein
MVGGLSRRGTLEQQSMVTTPRTCGARQRLRSFPDRIPGEDWEDKIGMTPGANVEFAMGFQ